MKCWLVRLDNLEMSTHPANHPKTRKTGRPADPELETRLLDSGWRMFLTRGVDAVSVEAVASQAGVSSARVRSFIITFRMYVILLPCPI